MSHTLSVCDRTCEFFHPGFDGCAPMLYSQMCRLHAPSRISLPCFEHFSTCTFLRAESVVLPLNTQHTAQRNIHKPACPHNCRHFNGKCPAVGERLHVRRQTAAWAVKLSLQAQCSLKTSSDA